MSAVSEINGALAATADAVKESLVHVRTRWGGGAGVIWREGGLIITNAHVARRGRVTVMMPDGQAIAGQVVAVDTDRDLAAVRVEAVGLVPARIGDARSLLPGALVFAHGHPWGVAGVMTSGVAIGTGADWPGLPAVNGRREWLVVNMRLRPGNSGGPVLDAEGRVVGIAAVMAGPEVGMAIPAHVVEEFVAKHVAAREPVTA